MFRYFVYVNKYDKRVRIHSFDCKKCKNIKMNRLCLRKILIDIVRPAEVW